ncbi:MAG: hypothetical protein E8D42_05935 [Nitrospira sp.]|nr:MAG: hypothetical protein E8D42_05935 [Nitrospira sp.]
MARARAVEHQRPRSKTTPTEEATLGIAKLQEVLAAINDLSQEGFPYRDAAQSKAELQFRECLRHAFGERSQEFQTYHNFKLRTADKAEVAQSLTVIKGLMHTLEDRKLELQGLKPPPKPEPSPEAILSNTARMVLVPSTPQPTVTEPTPSPMTVAVAMTTNVEPSIAPLLPIPQSQPPMPEPAILAPAPTLIPVRTPTPTPTPSPTPSLTPMPGIPQPPPLSVAVATPIPSPPPAPAAPPRSSTIERPIEVVPSPIAAPIVSSMPTQPHIPPPPPMSNNPSMHPELSLSLIHAPQDPPAGKQAIGLSIARVIESTPDQDPLNLVRKVCLRFHSVARQLRLRKDYRPTLEVDDDHDLQDLLCALLKVEFDEVSTDEWTPPYTGGTPRTTLLVNRDQIAIVAKKTGPGVTTKELADQVAADTAYYRAQGRCATVFCFIYDPEGRIGSPKRLETTLTSVSEHCRVEVLVAPK